ncbi:GGDEF domain-containing protein [Afipia carboxidovorans]|uniref:GGDEF domain-containing protein n=1 Tax=Afipia carboxidovorans TaxID=40137 RepID=UPI00308DDC81|nr:hypothetical protein CRBSH125_35920 [Afipia carboxidovorans]
MSQPGPIVVIADKTSAPLYKALSKAKLFPVVDSDWQEAATAIARVKPCAVLAVSPRDEVAFEDIARRVEILSPYVPLIALDPTLPLPNNALPLTDIGGRGAHRVADRLNAALRVRSLHSTVLRRARDTRLTELQMPTDDPLQDASVLLVGRGNSFPALSVALGERMGVIGALSIEQAAKHLNARSLDGIIIGGGFTPRVVDAFLLVLSEDSRYRNLPVVVSSTPISPEPYDLPNLEIVPEAADVVAIAAPLIRQKAFEARLNRASRSIEAGGMLDPRTGLLTEAAFLRDLSRLVEDAQAQGAGLSVARFTFTTRQDRSRYDAARIIGQLMRRMDIATLQGDGSIVVVFRGTSLDNARMISRRLASVLKQTAVGPKATGRLAADVSLSTLMPNDTGDSILARLHLADAQAAS